MKYILYVDGQLGLNFTSQDDAEVAASYYRQAGFDTHIIMEEDTISSTNIDSDVADL